MMPTIPVSSSISAWSLQVIPLKTDKEINGITFGSVGSGTTIDHLQVSYSNDDSFEWFGGAVNCKYLVAYKGWDDESDTDNGFSGTVQYCLSIRDPRIADTRNPMVSKAITTEQVQTSLHSQLQHLRM